MGRVQVENGFVIGSQSKTSYSDNEVPEPSIRPLGSYMSELENQTESMLGVAITIHNRMFENHVNLSPASEEPNSCMDNRLRRLVDMNADLFRILVCIEERL